MCFRDQIALFGCVLESPGFVRMRVKDLQNCNELCDTMVPCSGLLMDECDEAKL